MPTIIKLNSQPKTNYIARETYGTIKKRLWDSRFFMEISFAKAGKMLVNKGDVLSAENSLKKITPKKKKKAKQK